MGRGKQKPNRQAPNRKDQPALTAPRAKGPVVPSSSVLPGASNSAERVSWRFGHADRDGRWGLDNVSPDHWREIMAKMAHCETMKVSELTVTRRLFKDYDVPGPLAGEAVRRLTELQLVDLTKIHRLEFTGTQRLYGVLRDNVFHVIWWDPDHKICPTSKRNT